MGKKHGPEEIIGKLREAEIVLAQGGTTGDACRRIAVTQARRGEVKKPAPKRGLFNSGPKPLRWRENQKR